LTASNKVSAGVYFDKMYWGLAREPTAFPILAYDALRAAAIALSELDENVSIEVLRSKLFETINNYLGVTGTIELNSAGDRKEGNYSFWKISESGAPVWIKE